MKTVMPSTAESVGMKPGGGKVDMAGLYGGWDNHTTFSTFGNPDRGPYNHTYRPTNPISGSLGFHVSDTGQTMTSTLTALVVEDDWTVRETLRNFLTKRNIHVFEADSLESVTMLSPSLAPDVAIVDIVLPERVGERADFDQHVGIEVAKLLRELFPEIGIIFLSAYVDRGPEVIDMYMEGHQSISFLPKGSKPQELIDAIQRITQGSVSLEIAAGVRSQRSGTFKHTIDVLSPEERVAVLTALSAIETLSSPERRVFEVVGMCRTRKRAGEVLGISPKTVSSHMDAIYDKLKLRRADDDLNQLPLLAKVHLLHKLVQLDDR